MMEKNSRIEVGKTPAEDSDGKACTRIVDGEPVCNVASGKDNCFDKLAKLVYNVSEQDELQANKDKECCGDKSST